MTTAWNDTGRAPGVRSVCSNGACWWLFQTAALLVLLSAGLAGDVIADPGVLVTVAPGQVILLQRYEGPVKVDGVLDEPIWSQLDFYDQFLITDPDSLEKPRFDTRVRMFYSDRGLHVGVENAQPAETIIERLSGRDARQIARDGVGITLDSSGTGRYGYWFDLSLGDSISDGTVLPERQFSSDWDGPWLGATERNSAGWSAEFLIPWGTVSMPKTGEQRRMAFTVTRKVAFIEERWGWPALPSTRPQYMSALQPIQMDGVAPRQQYNFYPYTSVTIDEEKNKTEYKAGADLFWRPSTNFQLNATLNPDFGAVEVDDVVINLSALETFFPEKRLFFLEGQEVFTASPRADTRGGGIGNRGAPVTMVNTRRIGGKPEDPGFPDDYEVANRDLNEPVDLLGALKTTGQVGAFRYGVMAAAEDESRFDVITGQGEEQQVDLDGSDYGIARLIWENNAGGGYKALGVLSTMVRGGEGRDAYVQGIDWHYYTVGSRLKLDGQAFASDIDDESVGYGGFMDADYSIRQGVTQRFGFEYFDSNIDLNDLGFLQRNNYWQVRTAHGRTTSDLAWARENRFDARGFYRRNLEGDHIGSGVLLTDRVTFDSLRTVTVGANYFFPAYDDLNSFGNGTYKIDGRAQFFINYDSDSAREFSWGVGTGVRQEELGGTTYSGELNLRWRPGGRFSTGLRIAYYDRTEWLLHDEDRYMATFDALQWQPAVDIQYFLTARQQLRASLQWVGVKSRAKDYYLVPENPGKLIPVAQPDNGNDDFSVSELSFQLRYRWELAPLSDLYVVYTRVADDVQALNRESFRDIFSEAWNDVFINALVVKFRYRFGS